MNVILFPTSLAIEFQYLQRQSREVGENGDDNSVAVANEGQQHVQRQPPPRRHPDIIEALTSLFNRSISVITCIFQFSCLL